MGPMEAVPLLSAREHGKLKDIQKVYLQFHREERLIFHLVACSPNGCNCSGLGQAGASYPLRPSSTSRDLGQK